MLWYPHIIYNRKTKRRGMMLRNAIKLCLYWYKRYMSLHSKTVTRPSKKYRQHTQKMLPYEMCSSIKIPPYFKLNKAKCITTYQIYIWDSWSRSRGWYGLCSDKEERRKGDWSWGKKNRTEKGHPQFFPTSWVSWGRGWPSFWASVLVSAGIRYASYFHCLLIGSINVKHWW